MGNREKMASPEPRAPLVKGIKNRGTRVAESYIPVEQFSIRQAFRHAVPYMLVILPHPYFLQSNDIMLRVCQLVGDAAYTLSPVLGNKFEAPEAVFSAPRVAGKGGNVPAIESENPNMGLWHDGRWMEVSGAINRVPRL
jgi:hypothetical protein